jgi:hypothetical protein
MSQTLEEGVEKLERELDGLVYALYDLADEEMALVKDGAR